MGDQRLDVSCGDVAMAIAGIVSAIDRNGGNRLFRHLVQKIGQNLIIGDKIGGDFTGHHLFGCRIVGKM